MLIKLVKTAKQDTYYEFNENTHKYERTTNDHGNYMLSKKNTELVKCEYDKVKNKTTQYFKTV